MARQPSQNDRPRASDRKSLRAAPKSCINASPVALNALSGHRLGGAIGYGLEPASARSATVPGDGWAVAEGPSPPVGRQDVITVPEFGIERSTDL
jgi:hypothetical protein